jgi:hypothetical protein
MSAHMVNIVPAADASDSTSYRILHNMGVVLPLNLLKKPFIQGLDAALDSGNAFTLRHFLQKTVENIDDLVKTDSLDGFFDEIEKTRREITSSSLTNDDQKIIDFLAKSKKLGFKCFMQIIGPISVIDELLTDMGETKEKYGLSKKIEVALYLYLFQSIYETMILSFDRFLYEYVSGNNIKLSYKFMKIDRSATGHIEAGGINSALVQLKVVDGNNDSIVNTPFRGKRNAIGHFNAFYDSELDKIIINNEYMSLGELVEAFERLYLFFMSWMDCSFPANNLTRETFVEEFKKATVIDLEKTIQLLSRDVIRAHRYQWFGQIIIKLSE